MSRNEVEVELFLFRDLTPAVCSVYDSTFIKIKSKKKRLRQALTPEIDRGEIVKNNLAPLFQEEKRIDGAEH